MRIPLYSITDWHRSPISDSHFLPKRCWSESFICSSRIRIRSRRPAFSALTFCTMAIASVRSCSGSGCRYRHAYRRVSRPARRYQVSAWRSALNTSASCAARQHSRIPPGRYNETGSSAGAVAVVPRLSGSPDTLTGMKAGPCAFLSARAISFGQ